MAAASCAIAGLATMTINAAYLNILTIIDLTL
jgi:hypothetical protein